MQKRIKQLTLGLSLRDEATFDNFYAGKNAELVAVLKKIASGSGEKVIYLSGRQAEGRSHLLQACCHYAKRYQLSAIYLPFNTLLSSQNEFKTVTPEILNGFESLSLICLDDLHRIAGVTAWEEAVFHLYNRIYDAGGRIVITANDLPQSIQLQLPDLVSRLSWGMVYQLYSLADEEKLFVLTMRAKRRGISLSEEAGKYILTHCPRNMNTLFAVLDLLDKASLAAKRRLTVPFLKEVLALYPEHCQ